jgi:hypothetical protein
MATLPTAQEALERARRAQDQPLNAIRDLAQAPQDITDVRDQTARELGEPQAQIKTRVRDAEHADVRAYDAALAAGWTARELRKIGFPQPGKRARTRRRGARERHDLAESLGHEIPAPTDAVDVDRQPIHQ